MVTKKCVTQTRMWLKWAWLYTWGLVYYSFILPNVPMHGIQPMNYNIGHIIV
jgi:hypothetical protein